MKNKKALFIIIIFLIIIGVLALEKNKNINVVSKVSTEEKQENLVNKKEEIKKDSDVDEYLGDTIKITSMGNIIFHMPQVIAAQTSKGYDFNPSFEYLKDKIDGADISLAVLETTLMGDGNYSGYPCFNSPDEVLDAMSNCGINTINYANNHILDSGSEGVFKTIETTKNKGFDVIGVKEKASEPNYLIKKVKGHKIGMLSYVYESGEYDGVPTINGIPVPEKCRGLINTFDYFNLDEFYKNVKESLDNMKEEGAEFFILSIHWGEEYDSNYNSYQKSIAEKMNELGIDIILGNHPHVVQPYEILTNKDNKKTFVCYGQGNNLSNQSYDSLGDARTEDGLFLTFEIEIGKEGLSIKDYIVSPLWVYKDYSSGSLVYRIVPLDDTEVAITSAESLKRTESIVNKLGKYIF